LGFRNVARRIQDTFYTFIVHSNCKDKKRLKAPRYCQIIQIAVVRHEKTLDKFENDSTCVSFSTFFFFNYM